MLKKYALQCERCRVEEAFQARGRVKARIQAHAKGWASTSVESPTARHVCPKCAPNCPSLTPGGVPFKQSIFAKVLSAESIRSFGVERQRRPKHGLDPRDYLRMVIETVDCPFCCVGKSHPCRNPRTDNVWVATVHAMRKAAFHEWKRAHKEDYQQLRVSFLLTPRLDWWLENTERCGDRALMKAAKKARSVCAT